MSHSTDHFVTLDAKLWVALRRSGRAIRAAKRIFIRTLDAIGCSLPGFSFSSRVGRAAVYSHVVMNEDIQQLLSFHLKSACWELEDLWIHPSIIVEHGDPFRVQRLGKLPPPHRQARTTSYVAVDDTLSKFCWWGHVAKNQVKIIGAMLGLCGRIENQKHVQMDEPFVEEWHCWIPHVDNQSICHMARSPQYFQHVECWHHALSMFSVGPASLKSST